MGVLIIRALLLAIYIRSPDFLETPMSCLKYKCSTGCRFPEPASSNVHITNDTPYISRLLSLRPTRVATVAEVAARWRESIAASRGDVHTEPLATIIHLKARTCRPLDCRRHGAALASGCRKPRVPTGGSCLGCLFLNV